MNERKKDMENTELTTITNDAPDMVKGMYCSIHAETQEDRLDIYEAVSNSLPSMTWWGRSWRLRTSLFSPWK